MSRISGLPNRRSDAYRERNSTADRTLTVLGLFSDDKLVWSGLEIAEQLGAARSTAYRYLKGLAAVGFVEECAGGYRLGPRVLDLARLARQGIGLSQIARPVMRPLAEQVNETVILARRSGAVAVCVELEKSHQPIRLSYERGHILPLNAGASAQILFAWLSADIADELLGSVALQAFTDRSIVTAEKLRNRFADIRAKGYAITREELDYGVLGVAAPVLAADQQVVAGLSVAALASRVVKSRDVVYEVVV